MNKTFLFTLFSLLFASLQCHSSSPSASGNWEYINNSKIYVSSSKLIATINSTNIPGFDSHTQGAVPVDLGEDEGTSAACFYWLEGSSQQGHPQFMLSVYDSSQKVESLLTYSGEMPFEIVSKSRNLLYAHYKNKTSRYHCLILIKDRLLLDFTAHEIRPDELDRVCLTYDTREFEELVK